MGLIPTECLTFIQLHRTFNCEECFGEKNLWANGDYETAINSHQLTRSESVESLVSVLTSHTSDMVTISAIDSCLWGEVFEPEIAASQREI